MHTYFLAGTVPLTLKDESLYHDQFLKCPPHELKYIGFPHKKYCILICNRPTVHITGISYALCYLIVIKFILYL